ncbi:hypothetical protein BB558_007145, partial [Smittium angustum]
MDKTLETKYHILAFFSSPENDKYKCYLCQKDSKFLTQKKGSGYTNLTTHLNKGHPGFKELYLQVYSEEPPVEGKPSFFSYSSKIVNIYDWISLVTKCKLPISHCENPDFLNHTHLEGISIKTLTKYMNK